MEEIIRFVVCQKGRLRTPSFYLSILIAYLEDANWLEATKIHQLLQAMVLTEMEQDALTYLGKLLKSKDQVLILSLAHYLGDA